nr:MAG TPA: MID domain of medPIWI [Caudoviricetes sp.]
MYKAVIYIINPFNDCVLIVLIKILTGGNMYSAKGESP